MELSDKEVLTRMEAFTRKERQLQVEWLKHLAIVEERRLFNLAGFESLWMYVHKKLGYSEGSVGKRIQVSRTAKKFPLIYELMSSAKLSMAAVSRLSPHLTEKNHKGLLEQAANKSVREVEEIVAALAPKPDVPDSVRKVAGSSSQECFEIKPMEEKPSPPRAPKQKTVPLSAERFHLSFTVDRATHDKHKRLLALTRHLPKQLTMEDVYLAGIEALLKKHDPEQKLALKRKAPSKKKPAKHTRNVSRETRRELFAKDARCAYVSPDGKRCEATTNLQVDHVLPWGMGGSSKEISNLRLLCRSHNLYLAMQVYGKDFIESCFHSP